MKWRSGDCHPLWKALVRLSTRYLHVICNTCTWNSKIRKKQKKLRQFNCTHQKSKTRLIVTSKSPANVFQQPYAAGHHHAARVHHHWCSCWIQQNRKPPSLTKYEKGKKCSKLPSFQFDWSFAVRELYLSCSLLFGTMRQQRRRWSHGRHIYCVVRHWWWCKQRALRYRKFGCRQH